MEAKEAELTSAMSSMRDLEEQAQAASLSAASVARERSSALEREEVLRREHSSVMSERDAMVSRTEVLAEASALEAVRVAELSSQLETMQGKLSEASVSGAHSAALATDLAAKEAELWSATRTMRDLEEQVRAASMSAEAEAEEHVSALGREEALRQEHTGVLLQRDAIALRTESLAEAKAMESARVSELSGQLEAMRAASAVPTTAAGWMGSAVAAKQAQLVSDMEGMRIMQEQAAADAQEISELQVSAGVAKEMQEGLRLRHDQLVLHNAARVSALKQEIFDMQQMQTTLADSEVTAEPGPIGPATPTAGSGDSDGSPPVLLGSIAFPGAAAGGGAKAAPSPTREY